MQTRRSVRERRTCRGSPRRAGRRGARGGDRVSARVPRPDGRRPRGARSCAGRAAAEVRRRRRWRRSSTALEPAAIALDNALRVQRAEALSVTDDLTQLYNSRYLNQVLRRETKRALAQRPAAVAAVHRPRRVQGDQRHARPPVRQPGAGRGRRRHPRQRPRNRRRRAVRRRRVRADPARHRAAKAPQSVGERIRDRIAAHQFSGRATASTSG